MDEVNPREGSDPSGHMMGAEAKMQPRQLPSHTLQRWGHMLQRLGGTDYRDEVCMLQRWWGCTQPSPCSLLVHQRTHAGQ